MPDPNELAASVLAVLGENPHEILAMTIRFRAGAWPTVAIQRRLPPDREKGAKIVTAFERYKLTPK